MMSGERPLPWQRQLLTSARLRDGWTAASLAAEARALGRDVTEDAVKSWMCGRRDAPLWLLEVLLAHSDDPCAILGPLAEAHGARVVPDLDTHTDTDPMAGVVDVVVAASAALEAVRRDLADGRLDDDATLEVTERLLQLATELHASAQARLRLRVAR